MFASSLLGTLGERGALNNDGTAYATTPTSISLVTLRESGALGIGGPSAGRFVTGTMEYLAAARSCLALRDGQVVQKLKIRGWRGRTWRVADCAKAFESSGEVARIGIFFAEMGGVQWWIFKRCSAS